MTEHNTEQTPEGRYNHPADGEAKGQWHKAPEAVWAQQEIEIQNVVETFADLPTADGTQTDDGQKRRYFVSADNIIVRDTGNSWAIIGGLGSTDRPLPEQHVETLTTEDLKNVDGDPRTRAATVTVSKDGSDTVAIDEAGDRIDRGTDALSVLETIVARGAAQYITLQKGVYELSGTLDISPSNGLTFRGTSPQPDSSAVLKLADGVNGNMIEYNDTTQGFFYTFENLYLDGNKDNNTAGSLIDTEVGGGDVGDCMIYNCFLDDAAEYCVKINPWNTKIIGCTFEHAGEAGLYAVAGRDLKVIGNKFIRNDKLGVLWRASKSQFTNNFVFRNGQHGFQNDAPGATETTIANCAFQANSHGNSNVYNQLWIEGSDWKVMGCSFDGNLSSTDYSRYGISVRSGATDTRIRDVNTTGHTQDGIQDGGTRTRINGVGTESANAETPTTADWDTGDVVDFTDSGDGSGDGVYKLLPDDSWSQIGST